MYISKSYIATSTIFLFLIEYWYMGFNTMEWFKQVCEQVFYLFVLSVGAETKR